MEINGIPVEDTYCEAFDGYVMRLLITADNDKLLKKAAYGSTALPSTVVGRTEGGVECWITQEETPDKRRGAIIQIWGNYSKDPTKFLNECSLRIRQGILVIPTTKLFNALPIGEKWDSMHEVGYCGDGYEKVIKKYNREIIEVPIMVGSFEIERYLHYTKGVMGGNIWIMCNSMKSALNSGWKAVDAVNKVKYAVSTFDICSAGSKVGSEAAEKSKDKEIVEKYKAIGPTTNHEYCPTLRGVVKETKVPLDVNSIPEIVMNGVTMDSVREAMKEALVAASAVEGVVRLSAGNYGGDLGRHKIYLKDLI